MGNNSIIIKTPRGSISTKTLKNGKITSKLIWEDGFGPTKTNQFKNAQEYVDNAVLRYCDPLVPFRSGVLKKSGTLMTVIGNGLVEYKTPYARKMYYGNKSSGQRGGYWFERMKASNKDTIKKGAISFVK